ncbi:MAG TPA: transcription termination factor Rho [Candidatus Anaerobutyricum faecale]|nr:transcription termination factor Rho [Candidatus Anaerobutyricum faecale]
MNYRNMTLLQLRAAAKEKGLRGISTLKKEQLIERLMETEHTSNTERPERHPSHFGEKGRTERQNHEHMNGERADHGRRNFEQPRNNEHQEYERRTEERTEYGRSENERPEHSRTENGRTENGMKSELESLDSGEKANGILEVMPDGYGFIRCENYLPGENDVYVSPSQIRRFNLKTGDILVGNTRVKTQNEKYSALLYVESVNGYKPYEAQRRKSFEDLTPIFPNERIRLEIPGAPVSMRMVDLLSPIGKGQRGMIVSQPKTGKTTLLKQIAKSITTAYSDMKLIVLLIDERPEEVTDIREYIEGPNAEVIYSTFDELPEHHKRVSEMVLERAKRLVEHGEDVVILLDSITRLARAYNLVVPPSGRTLSGGLDPAALHMPKKFFGAARNMREGGSLTILATALVDTGSKMDDVVFEEFKGTGNMELVLDRKLSEKRIFPAINIQKSGTRRDDLLLTKEEQEIVFALHREMSGNRAEENVEQILQFFKRTKNNQEFIQVMRQSLLK